MSRYEAVAREQRSLNTRNDHDDIEHVDLPPQDRAKELSAETEDLIAEIDDLLEENAEEFVAGFIQQVGQ